MIMRDTCHIVMQLRRGHMTTGQVNFAKESFRIGTGTQAFTYVGCRLLLCDRDVCRVCGWRDERTDRLGTRMGVFSSDCLPRIVCGGGVQAVTSLHLDLKATDEHTVHVPPACMYCMGNPVQLGLHMSM